MDVLGVIIYRSKADISTNNISPLECLSNSCHIPYFLRPLHTYLTKYGGGMTENLLKYLYGLGLYIVDNREFSKLQFSRHYHLGKKAFRADQDRFFDNIFPFIVLVGTRDDVLEILKSHYR